MLLSHISSKSIFIDIQAHWTRIKLIVCHLCVVLFYSMCILCVRMRVLWNLPCARLLFRILFFGTHFFSRKDCWFSSNMPTITVEHITLSHFSCFFVCLYIHLMLKIVSEICFELAKDVKPNWYLTAAAEFTKTSTVQITVKLLFTICLIFFEASSKPNHFVYNHQQYIYVCTLLSSNHWPPNQYAYLEIKQQKKKCVSSVHRYLS